MAAANENQQRPLTQHGWQKGQSGNPAGLSKPLREVRKLAQAMCPEAMAKLGEIMRGDDARASLEAIKIILARAIGKEREHEGLYPGKERHLAFSPLGDVDLKVLSDSQLDRIESIIKENAP